MIGEFVSIRADLGHRSDWGIGGETQNPKLETVNMIDKTNTYIFADDFPPRAGRTFLIPEKPHKTGTFRAGPHDLRTEHHENTTSEFGKNTGKLDPIRSRDWASSWASEDRKGKVRR